MLCFKCHSYLSSNDKYCSKCGTKKIDESVLISDIYSVEYLTMEKFLDLSLKEIVQELANSFNDWYVFPSFFSHNYLKKLSRPILKKINPDIHHRFYDRRSDYHRKKNYLLESKIKYRILEAFDYLNIRGLIFPLSKEDVIFFKLNMYLLILTEIILIR